MNKDSTVKLIGTDPNAGNNPLNPNGMKLYSYRGQRIAAYRAADVPARFRYLYPNAPRSRRANR